MGGSGITAALREVKALSCAGGRTDWILGNIPSLKER